MKQISVVACHFAALVLTQGILLTFAKAEGEGDPKSKVRAVSVLTVGATIQKV